MRDRVMIKYAAILAASLVCNVHAYEPDRYGMSCDDKCQEAIADRISDRLIEEQRARIRLKEKIDADLARKRKEEYEKKKARFEWAEYADGLIMIYFPMDNFWCPHGDKRCNKKLDDLRRKAIKTHKEAKKNGSQLIDD